MARTTLNLGHAPLSKQYPTNFLVLHPNTKSNSYHIVLGRPQLAIFYAYISCMDEKMTIKNGQLRKQLVLYPPIEPLIEHDLPMWLEVE